MSLPNPLPELENGPLPYAESLRLGRIGSYHIEPDEDDFSAVSERQLSHSPPISQQILLTLPSDNCRLG